MKTPEIRVCSLKGAQEEGFPPRRAPRAKEEVALFEPRGGGALGR